MNVDHKMEMSLTSSVELSSGSDGQSEVGDSLLELLVNFSQCSDDRCSSPDCFQLKKDVQNLESALKKGTSHMDQYNLKTLRLLSEHYLSCTLPNCRVPWCRYMTYRCQKTRSDTLQELMSVLNYPMLTLLPPDTTFDESVTLADGDVGDEVEEWDHWLIISPLSPSLMVALAAPLKAPGQHWVVKMTPLQEGDNQLSVLRKLRGLQHRHLVSHVWAASCTDHDALVICTQHLPGRSVKDVLRERGELSYAQARLLFTQVLYAAQALHQLNIIFLNWKCSNLLLDLGEQQVKVSNFGTAVDLSTKNVDLGTIKLTLPTDLVPVEVMQGGQLSPRTDSWGLATLVHEMMTGVRPWHRLRHSSHSDLEKQILAQSPPEVDPSLPEHVRALVHSCLQKNPESRLSVLYMITHLNAELD